MRASNIKSDTPFSIRSNKSLGIQNYDLGNDFPQKVEEIVRASGTGMSCVRVYRKFIFGGGFKNTDVSKVVANRRGQTLDYILKQCAADFALYHGFALHVNYNAIFRITEIYHIPFEHCRFEAKGKETRTFSRVAVYDDWTLRDPERRTIKKDEIDFIDLFDPKPALIEEQVKAAGGWHKYKGQIYYYSGDGEKEYPAPIFSAELTNMRSEEGVDNVVGRNVCSNFLPGAIIVDINNTTESSEDFKQMKAELRQFVGDENAGNLFAMQVDSKESVPVKIDLHADNYDKEFAVTQKYLPDAIGRAFSQPPILRAQDVGANFGADIITNAYKYYNAQTAEERAELSRVFMQLFERWHVVGELTDADVTPLSYNSGASKAEIMGEKTVENVIGVITNPDLTTDQKLYMLQMFYDFEPNEAVELLKK